MIQGNELNCKINYPSFTIPPKMNNNLTKYVTMYLHFPNVLIIIFISKFLLRKER